MEPSKKPMQKLMDSLMPSCEIVSHKISESMDYKISIVDRARVRIHLMVCDLCTRYRDQLLTIQKMIDHLYDEDTIPDSDSSPQLSEDARIRMIENLNEQNK